MTEHQFADILKCAICSKSLDVPKRLACLHIFCKSCICQHVEKVIESEVEDERCNRFSCPVCKTVIKIPEQITPSLYANELPTNHLIDALIKRKKMQNKEVNCGWCLQEEKCQSANIWCEGCNDGLCENCFKVHKRIKALKTHKVLGVEDVTNFFNKLHFEIQCEIHKGKIVEGLCHDHQTTCCSLCIIDYHRNCDHLTTIHTASKNQGQSISELIQTIDDVIDIANDFIDSRNRNLKEIGQEKDEIIEKIRSLRNKIVTHLEKLEKDFQQRFDRNHANIRKEIEDEIENCSNHKAIVINCKQLLSLSVAHLSDENAFTEKQSIKKKIKEEVEIVDKITKQPIMRRYEIELTPDLMNLTERVTSLGTFRNTLGTQVQFVGKPLRKLPRNVDTITKNNDAQEILSFNPEKFPVQKIHGAKIHRDGRIVLTNAESKCLLIFDSTGKLKQEITLPGKPNDVTLISDCEAAVSYWFPIGIAVVNITTGIIKQKNIMTNSNIKVCGITSDGVKIAAISDTNILFMETSGSIVSHIKTQTSFEQRYVTFVTNNRVCYSNMNPDVVHCIDLDGTEIFTYQHEDLKCPYSITCNNEGMIYVAGFKSHNIHQISPTGQLMKIILSKENGIKDPLAIHYNCYTELLLVTHSHKTVSVYEMK